MAEKYSDELFKYLRMYSASARKTAAALGIDAGPVLGSILEEANDRYGGSVNPSRFTRIAGDGRDYF